MEDTPESIVRYISVYLGPQNFNTFHLSLYRSILDSRDKTTDKERFDQVVHVWLGHFNITSERDKEQTSIVTPAQIASELLSDLMFSTPDLPKVGRDNVAELKTAKTNWFFDQVLAKLPPPPNIQAEIRQFTASILQSLGTDEQELPVSSKSTVPLNAQLVNLKKHINEKDTDDFKIRQELRKKVELIKKGIEDDEGTARDDEDKARIDPLDTACDTLFDTLIDMIIAPPPFHSHKSTLQSLFDLPMSIHDSDTALRNRLKSLFVTSKENGSSQTHLEFIVNELVQYLLDSQTDTNFMSTEETYKNFNKRRKAHIAFNLLSTIVDLQHETVETRLESVTKEIDVVQCRLSFVLLMDYFDLLARNMNILVTPHSILKGLSERAESTSDQLDFDRQRVFYRNVRDAGLSEWVQTATETLLDLIDTPETDCVNYHEQTKTRKMQLEERVLDTVTPSILTNVNEVIKDFFAAHENGHNPVDNPKWLAIVRSMMNTLLFLIDAGMSRHEMMSRCERLGELLEAVYEGHKIHLESVAEYSMHRADRGDRAVLDDEDDDDENAADFVNDLTIFSTHLSAMKYQPTDRKDSEATKPDFDVESLRTLELPRTLQMNPESQDCLERMSIALFARNLLWFLTVGNLPMDDESYVNQFNFEFMQDKNPEDVVHRSFVDFMNMTGLLSQRNFGLKREEFEERLTNEEAALENGTFTLQKMKDSLSLLSPTDFVTFSRRDELLISPDDLARYYPLEVKNQPFLSLMTRQVGVHLLLWASTELLSKAACGVNSKQSGTDQTASCLNVTRASIFGPSPRWLTSTDVRTNRGLSFLWDGVLKSEDDHALWRSDKSNHSQMMSFNTDRILFENTLDAAWDDMTALVPVLSDYKKEEEPRTHQNAVYSLMGKKTHAAIEKMKSQICFVAVSPFMEQIMRSEAISAIARLTTQKDYEEFRKVQAVKHIDNMPTCLEAHLVCISFLLDFPTPIKFSTATTSFHRELVRSNTKKHFSSYSPVLETKTRIVTSMPMLTFPKFSNRSVHDMTLPQALSETKRGETDLYFAEVLRKKRFGSSSGFDGLIVSRGSDRTRETIFMPIQATKSITRPEMEDGMVLIQQLLFQVMCHLEPSEGIVALFNSPTRPKSQYCQTEEGETTLPWQTGILGFLMVSSFLKFEENTLKHMPSILRHRDHPLVTTRTSPHSTMTTRDITETLLANVGHYPTFSTEFDPWTTSLPPVSNPTDPSPALPFRWRLFYDLFWTSSSANRFVHSANLPLFKKDAEKAKEWLDRMVRRTMQELNRVGISPDELGESETERINTFSDFLLFTAISCRRNKLVDPTSLSTTSADDALFVLLVKTIIRPVKSETLKSLLASINDKTAQSAQIDHNERLRSLDQLYIHPCIEARLHIVQQIMSNHAMNRIRSPAQEYLSVLQSKKDGGVFRVPTRLNLSAILHCGTVLLDNITPISDIDISPTVEQDLPRLTSPLTLNPTGVQVSTPPHSQSTSEPPPRSKTLRIPLHSFVLAKYGFSDSIPALCELTQSQLRKHVTNVAPAPLSRWHPRRVVIDPSLFPHHIPKVESLSLFTSFIHRLFDNAFIAVTTSLSTEMADLPLDEPFLLSRIRKIEAILSSVDLEKHDRLRDLLSQLSSIQTSAQASTIFSILPTIRSSFRRDPLPSKQTPPNRKPLSVQQLRDVLATIESIEDIRLNPTLFFVKSGSDFFTSPNASCLDGVDTTTESRAFPITFSTGYKETDLRKELKQVFEPLTRLLPDHFPTGRPSLMHVDNEGNQKQRNASSSKKEAEDRAQAIVDSAILRMGATSKTPLFVFVVDEDLADHSSLPMSLLSSDGCVGCGMMRQRSLADVLWILFLTRISREVMALPLNTSINSSDFSNSIIPFLSNVLIDAKVIQHSFYSYSIPTVLNTLTSRATTRRLNNRNRISSVGLELLESAYPHVKDQTHVLLLSHLLMACPSGRNGRSRLDALVNHPSPKIGLVALIRWFQLLSSFAKKIKLEKAIESNGFTLAKVETLLLRAFYQIVEHDGPDDLITQLYEAIKSLLILERQPLFFRTAQQQTLQELKLVTDTRCKTHAKDSPRAKVLAKIKGLIDTVLALSLVAQQNIQGISTHRPDFEVMTITQPNSQGTFSTKRRGSV